MALVNPSGLYQGTPSLNPLPYVNIVMQARNRKAAREEAIDKYYQKLPDTINDKGLRDQEIPIINDFKSKIFEFGVKNREALKNPKIDNGAAQLNLDKLMREAASIARLSQNAAKVDLQAGKFFLNKDNQYALNNDAYLADNELHNLPVNDPRHKTLDLEKFAANRPFNEVGFVKDIKTKFPYSEKVVRQPDPTDPNYEIVTTLPVLDEKAKIQMVSDAADRFHNDPTFRKKIKTDLAGTGQINELLQIAQDVFGVKPEEMDDEMLAAAYTYSKLPIGKTKEKVQPSIAGKQEFAKGMQEDRQRHAEAMQLRAHKNAMERLRLQAQLGIDKADKTTPVPPNLLDELTTKFGETFKPFWGEPQIVVDVNNIPKQYRTLISVSPIDLGNGKKVYKVNEDGSYEGSNGQKSTPVAVADSYMKVFGNSKIKLEGREKFLEQNKSKTVTPQPAKKTSTKQGSLNDL